MANIKPTQNFVLIELVSTTDLVMPDGQRDPNEKIIVRALGPDVPENPAIGVGDHVLLRGDTKFFEAEQGKKQWLIDARSITAVVENEEVVPLTDEQIEAIRLG